MEIKAIARYIRVSPTKVRLVARPLQGKSVEEALAVLGFMPQRGARLVRKVVASALANAEQRAQVDVDRLYVKGVQVDEGPSLKRFQPRAMGRVNHILKRSCHITVVLDEKPVKKVASSQ